VVGLRSCLVSIRRYHRSEFACEEARYTPYSDAPCSHTTTMSNIPTPKEIPPTPQQVDRTLQSVISAAQSLISSDPRHFANLRASFLALYTHPTFQLILGIPSQTPANEPQPNKQLQTDLNALKSSITALTKSVADLQPKVKEAKAPTSKPPPRVLPGLASSQSQAKPSPI
jgi:hypothetical protein